MPLDLPSAGSLGSSGGGGGGVTSIIAGAGISINQPTGAVTITNTGGGGGGVTSIAGTTNQVVSSASTGAVVLSLPSVIQGVSSFNSSDGNPSLDIENRLMYLDVLTPTASVDWQNAVLFYGNTSVSVQWSEALLFDGTGSQSLDWANRFFSDPVGNPVLAWDATNVVQVSGLTSFSGAPLTLSSWDTNQNIVLAPNGSGAVWIGAEATGVNLISQTGFFQNVLANSVFNSSVSLVAQMTSGNFDIQSLLTVQGGANALLVARSAVTSGAASGVGTLTNAPHSGPPDVWAPMTFNGVPGWMPWWHA